jgi:hypothetical protein
MSASMTAPGPQGESDDHPQSGDTAPAARPGERAAWADTLAGAVVRAVQAPAAGEFRRLLALVAVVALVAATVLAAVLLIHG